MMKRAAGSGAVAIARGVAAVSFAFILACPSRGGEGIKLPALIKETQMQSEDPGKMTLVWWLPEEFWRASMAQNPGVTKQMVQEIVDTVRPYTMVVVIDGDIGAFGGVTYRSEAVVRGKTTLKDASGRTHTPLPADRIDPDTTNLMKMMKPLLANMAGPMGQNMHFFVFPAKDRNGKAIADATKEGSLTIAVGKEEFAFRLPLGSVLPPKYDPKTREKFPGNYNYNPFTGTQLVTEPPKRPAGTSK
ncbi:MAG: hypothetical protein ACYTKD_23500 [Planctomycetota bacterium]|jgi:hypothetical protein